MWIIKRIVKINFLFIVLCVLAQSSASAQSQIPEAHSQDLDQETLDRMQKELEEIQEQTRIEDEKRKAEADRIATENARQEALEKRNQEQKRKQALAAIDPLLRAAWEGYTDYHHRDREQVKQLFLRYIEQNPQTPFAPEIYYRIGSMYSNNANHRNGETFDRAERNKYFTLAVEGYKDTFSVEAEAARSFLVSNPRQSTAERLEYYDWLIGFEGQVEAKDIHPVQPISEHVGYAEPVIQTEDEMKMRVAQVKRVRETFVTAAENNIIRLVKGPEDLGLIAERYPDRRIGELAKKKLGTWESKLLDADTVLDHPDFTEVKEGSDNALVPVAEASDDIDGPPLEEDVEKERDAVNQASSSGLKTHHLIIAGVFIILTVFIVRRLFQNQGKQAQR